MLPSAFRSTGSSSSESSTHTPGGTTLLSPESPVPESLMWSRRPSVMSGPYRSYYAPTSSIRRPVALHGARTKVHQEFTAPGAPVGPASYPVRRQRPSDGYPPECTHDGTLRHSSRTRRPGLAYGLPRAFIAFFRRIL